MNQPRPKISVVVPIYNEAEVLLELHQRLAGVLESYRPYQLIFVDDGSSDQSLQILEQIEQKHPQQVQVLQLSRNFGQTAALAAGLDAALGDLVVTMDGDLQHQPEEIPRLLERIDQGYDLVNGARVERRDNFFLRRLPSYLANLLMRRFSGINILDFGSTFKVYRRELLQKLELFGELHRFIPVLAAQVGARLTEVPITVVERRSGQSKYGLWRTFGVFEDLIFLSFYTHYLTKPLRAFGSLFFVFFGVGFAISAILMTLWGLALIERVADHSALLLLSIFLMTVGILFFCVGILAEILMRVYHHTAAKKIYTLRSKR